MAAVITVGVGLLGGKDKRNRYALPFNLVNSSASGLLL